MSLQIVDLYDLLLGSAAKTENARYQQRIDLLAQATSLAERERVLSDNGTTEIKLYNVGLFDGKTIPRETHPIQTQYVLVLGGVARVTIGDAINELRAGDMIIVPRNTPHVIEQSGNEDLRLVSFYVTERPPVHKAIANK